MNLELAQELIDYLNDDAVVARGCIADAARRLRDLDERIQRVKTAWSEWDGALATEEYHELIDAIDCL